MHKNYLNRENMDNLTQQTVWIHFHFSNQNLTFSIRTTTRSQRLLANRPSRQLSHKCLKSKVLQKNKSSSSTSPPTPPGSTCRKSTLLLMMLKESRGYLHPGEIFMNYLPIFDIAFFLLGLLPSHFSCS